MYVKQHTVYRINTLFVFITSIEPSDLWIHNRFLQTFTLTKGERGVFPKGGNSLQNRASFGRMDNNNEWITLTNSHTKIIAERNVLVKLKKKKGLTINNIIVNVSLERWYITIHTMCRLFK